MALPPRKVDYYAPTGSPDELSANDWNALLDTIEGILTGGMGVPGFGTTYNTAAGLGALPVVTSGARDTAFGAQALAATTTGSDNVAVGYRALATNTIGTANVAVGSQAMESYLDGATGGNVAVGNRALSTATQSTYNVALGSQSLRASTTGFSNTGVGANTLQSNTTGNQNVALGVSAVQANTTGSGNTGVGPNALYRNISGNQNVALGYNTGAYLETGSGNTIVGAGVVGGASWTNMLVLASGGVPRATFDGTAWTLTGTLSVANLMGGATTASIDANGNIVRATSDARLKDGIRDLGSCLGTVLSLRPRAFQYRPEANQGTRTRVGFIAQEVIPVLPEVVSQGEDGMLSLNYGEVTAVLVGAIHELAAEVNRLKEAVV